MAMEGYEKLLVKHLKKNENLEHRRRKRIKLEVNYRKLR